MSVLSFSNMSGVQRLKLIINQRLTIVAEEIFTILEKTFAEYEEEIERQRRLLSFSSAPLVKLERVDHQEDNADELTSEADQCGYEVDFTPDSEDQVELQIQEIQLKEEHLEVEQETDFYAREDPVPASSSRQTRDKENLALSDKSAEDPDEDDLSPASPADGKNTRKSKIAYCCGVCQKPFSCPSKLHIHSRSHTGERPFSCNICGTSFKERWTMKRHLSVHMEKPFPCKVCGGSFRDPYSLRRHMTVHTEEKPFACDVCHRRFKTEVSLRSHAIVHSVEKLHVCAVCGKRFPHVKILRRHMKSHSKDLEDPVKMLYMKKP